MHKTKKEQEIIEGLKPVCICKGIRTRVFEERVPLYVKYADITITCGRLTHEEICARIIGELKKGH